MRTNEVGNRWLPVILGGFALAGLIGCSGDDPTSPVDQTGTYDPPDLELVYAIVDTDQSTCYDNQAAIPDPGAGVLESPQDKLTWSEAQAYPAALNAAGFGGFDDWRLPDVKELQSIVDYSRSPSSSGSAAVDPIFQATAITSEAGETDYAFYWSSTTHANAMGGRSGAYVAFGRSLGFMNGSWVDVHGAGSQRSDPKTGDPADYPTGFGPQGDAIRIFNFVRLVRSADAGA